MAFSMFINILPQLRLLRQSTREDRTGWERQKGFSEGTEVSKDEIMAVPHQIPIKGLSHCNQGTPFLM